MDSKMRYKMGKINYINASPVYYGLDNGMLPEWLEMISEPPAVLNSMIINQDLILSPVSAAFYGMHHKELLLLPDFSISCHGHVMSVILVSKYPLEELNGKNIILTDESASAVSFLRMIFSLKNIVPILQTCSIKKISDIEDNVDAALVIGDAALTQPWESLFNYRIDLGDFWYSMTKKPFVFAVWAVKRSFAQKEPQIVRNIISLLKQSRESGYANIEKIIQTGAEKLNLEKAFVEKYYNHLYCDFDKEKKDALEMFFRFIYEENILKEKVKIELFK
jgi:chorismate dehydratase